MTIQDVRLMTCKLWQFGPLVFPQDLLKTFQTKTTTCMQNLHNCSLHNIYLVGGFNPIKNIFVKLDHFQRDRGKHKTYLKPPPSYYLQFTISWEPKGTPPPMTVISSFQNGSFTFDKTQGSEGTSIRLGDEPEGRSSTWSHGNTALLALPFCFMFQPLGVFFKKKYWLVGSR